MAALLCDLDVVAANASVTHRDILQRPADVCYPHPLTATAAWSFVGGFACPPRGAAPRRARAVEVDRPIVMMTEPPRDRMTKAATSAFLTALPQLTFSIYF